MRFLIWRKKKSEIGQPRFAVYMHVYIYPRGIFDFCPLDITDATCLLNSGMVHLTCSGYQKEASII